MDISQLGAQVDAQQVRTAATEIDGLRSSADRAASSLAKLADSGRDVQGGLGAALKAASDAAKAFGGIDSQARAAAGSIADMVSAFDKMGDKSKGMSGFVGAAASALKDFLSQAKDVKSVVSEAASGVEKIGGKAKEASASQGSSAIGTRKLSFSSKDLAEPVEEAAKGFDKAGKVKETSEEVVKATGKIRGSMVDLAKDLVSGEEPMTAFAKNGLDIASSAAEAGMGIGDVAEAMGLMTPVGAGIAVVGAAGAAAFFGLKAAADKAADNKDFINSLGLSKDQIAQLKDTSVTAGDVFGGLGKTVEDLWNSINKGDVVGKTINNMLKGLKDTAAIVVKAIADTIIDIIAYAVGGEAAYISAWAHAPEALGDLAITAANNVLKGLENIVNASLHAVGSLMDKLGIKNDFGKMSIQIGEIDNPFKGKAASWGSDVMKDFNAGFSGTKSLLHGMITAAGDDLNALGKAVVDTSGKLINPLVDNIVDTYKDRITNEAAEKKAEDQKAADAQKAQNAAAQKNACQCQGVSQSTADSAAESGVVQTDLSSSTISSPYSLVGQSGAASPEALDTYQRTVQDLKNKMDDGTISAVKYLEEVAKAQEIMEKKPGLSGFGDLQSKPKSFDLPPLEGVILNSLPTSIKSASTQLSGLTAVFKTFGTSAVQSLEKVITSGGNLGKTMMDAFKQIATSYLNSQIEKIFNSLGKSLSKSGNGVLSFIGSLFTKNALGGVYASPSLSAYSGGVYDSPRMFAFANGAGVFAEAGPEAIMPLSRGSDGKLGVKASGGSGSDSSQIRVYVDQDGNWQAAVEQIASNVATPIAQQAGVAAAQGGSSMAITRQNKTQRNRLS